MPRKWRHREPRAALVSSVEFDHCAGGNAAGRTVEKIAIDHDAKEWPPSAWPDGSILPAKQLDLWRILVASVRAFHLAQGGRLTAYSWPARDEFQDVLSTTAVEKDWPCALLRDNG